MAGTSADKLNKLKQTKADIKAAIREKGQAVSDADTFASYADKIRAIDNDFVLQEKTVTENGTYTADDGYNALSSVTVNVPSPEGTREITENGVFDVEEYEKVEVHVPQPSGTTIITENGTHDVSDYAAAVVDVPKTEANLTTLVTEASGTFTPDTYGADGFDKVVVNIPKSTFMELKVTSNGTYKAETYGKDGFDTVTVEVPTSGGGGECSGNHIIEVAELPTENIDENAMYKVGDSYYHPDGGFRDVIMYMGEAESFMEMAASEGITVELYHVITKPTENIIASDLSAFCALYFVEDESDIFAYMDGAWLTLSEIFGGSFTYQGTISDVSEATTTGYYALGGDGWIKYLVPKGSITITENSTVNVADKATVNVNIQQTYHYVKTANDLPANATTNDCAIVMSGDSKLSGVIMPTFFSGISSQPAGQDIWTDGEDVYYSSYDVHYKLVDKKARIWEKITDWSTVGFHGSGVWTDGTNLYHSSSQNYVFDRETKTWKNKDWNSAPPIHFYGSSVWTDGTNIYHSFYDAHHVLNKETDSWEEKTWNGTWNGATGKTAGSIWTYGGDVYDSYGTSHYVLNKETDTWEPKTWYGLTDFSPSYLWTDGINMYYSNGTVHYVLNKETDTWEPKDWGVSGSEISWPPRIWTDGTHVYYNGHLLLPAASLYFYTGSSWKKIGDIGEAPTDT